MNRILPLLALFAAAAVVAGCSHPLQPYDQGRATLQRSHELLADGDAALAANKFADAADLYTRADGKARSAVTCFQDAERQIEYDIQTQDAAPHSNSAQGQTVTIDSHQVSAAPYHADTLRAYRESLALAVILRSLATTRTADASYRQAAAEVAAGDQFYRARQFASAERCYDQAKYDFRSAQSRWADASAFIEAQMIGSTRLAAAAPRGSWADMKDVQVLLDRRRTQTDAYLSALQERAALAGRVVEAYRARQTGDLPAVVPQNLPDLPDIVRYSVTHPPVPDTALVR